MAKTNGSDDFSDSVTNTSLVHTLSLQLPEQQQPGKGPEISEANHALPLISFP